MTYPTKVERILRAIEDVEYRPWQDVTVEDQDGLYIIRAIRPGNVFVAESLSLYVRVHKAYTIEGTDLRMRAGQRFQGGTHYRFGGDLKITGWPDLDWKIK